MKTHLDINIAANLAIAWYFSSYLILRSGLAELPIIAVSIILIFKNKKNNNNKYKNWAIGSSLFASTMILMLAIKGVDTNNYEGYAKILLGAFIAYQLSKTNININYLITGTLICGITLTALIYTDYTDQWRYSNNLNPNKWAIGVLLNLVLAYALTHICKHKLLKAALIASALISLYAIYLTESRGAGIAAIISITTIKLCSIKKPEKKIRLLLLIGILTPLVLIPTIGDKMIIETKNPSIDNSTGSRIILIKTGLELFKTNPLTGNSFSPKENIINIKNPTQEEIYINKSYGSYHNIYVDALARFGILGLAALIIFITYQIKGKVKKEIILNAPIITVIIVSGLFESIFDMAIIASYIGIGGAILNNISIKNKEKYNLE